MKISRCGKSKVARLNQGKMHSAWRFAQRDVMSGEMGRRVKDISNLLSSTSRPSRIVAMRSAF
jgi:hypothetical protein